MSDYLDYSRWLEEAEDRPGVYFVSCDGWTKIGMSEDSVAKRVRSLQLPPSYKFVTAIYCDEPRKLERAIHEKISWLRYSRTEWFKIEPGFLERFLFELRNDRDFLRYL